MPPEDPRATRNRFSAGRRALPLAQGRGSCLSSRRKNASAGRGSCLLALLALALLSSCVSDEAGSIFVHPNADLGHFQRVAVLPLENLTQDRFAGDRVRETLVVELASLGAFQVLDPGIVNKTLRQEGISTTTELGPEEAIRLGRALGVDGLLLGTVMEYRERRSGTFTVPEVAISVRLMETENGLAVWSATSARTGMRLKTRLFGVGEQSATDVVRDLVRELMAGIYERGA